MRSPDGDPCNAAVTKRNAGETYKEAYNNAEKQYEVPKKRRGEESQEETTHRVSWPAVKQKHEKKKGRWVRKEE